MPHVPDPVSPAPRAVGPSAAVAAALAAGRPVVALESTLLAHGLPAPRNRAVGRRTAAAPHRRGPDPPYG